MEKRNFDNSHSAFYDLPVGDAKKSSGQGELQIFSESLRRKNQNEPQPAAAVHKSSHSPRPKKRKSKRRHKPRENRNVTLTVIMIYAAVGFFVGSLMVARYSHIIRKDDELDAMEAKIEEMQEKAEALRLEVSLKDDIGMVQKQAKGRLGLYYPSNSQIVYVELEEEKAGAENELVQNETNLQ